MEPYWKRAGGPRVWIRPCYTLNDKNVYCINVRPCNEFLYGLHDTQRNRFHICNQDGCPSFLDLVEQWNTLSWYPTLREAISALAEQLTCPDALPEYGDSLDHRWNMLFAMKEIDDIRQKVLAWNVKKMRRLRRHAEECTHCYDVEEREEDRFSSYSDRSDCSDCPYCAQYEASLRESTIEYDEIREEPCMRFGCREACDGPIEQDKDKRRCDCKDELPRGVCRVFLRGE